jgi:ApaG protein
MMSFLSGVRPEGGGMELTCRAMARQPGGPVIVTMIAAMTRPQFTCQVVTQYLPEQSDAAQGQYAFAYTITVRNTGPVAGQLVARHWIITDATGHTEEVRGLAVVGHQPLLKPGEQFEYTSWTRIGTPHGSMRGTFFCITEDAHWFDTPVEPFVLSLPQALH